MPSTSLFLSLPTYAVEREETFRRLLPLDHGNTRVAAPLLLTVSSSFSYNLSCGSVLLCYRAGERWEVIITPSEGQFDNISFVNSIWTMKGGTHVGHVADQVAAKVVDFVTKKHKGLKVKPFQVGFVLTILRPTGFSFTEIASPKHEFRVVLSFFLFFSVTLRRKIPP